MATANISDFVTGIGRRLAGAAVAPEPDAGLLARFLATQDEAAFAALVRRHGPMVVGVCRRVAGDHHLAEDAFQAVFVVLAAKAGSIRPRSALAAWLYAVAYRTALRARTMSDRRRRRECPVATLPDAPDPRADAAETADLVEVLDAEIARLPDHLRLPVVLCELQGRGRREAAAELRIAEGTLSSRLAAARKALAGRLKNRGVALSAAGLTAALSQLASASVPTNLAVRAATAALTPNLVPAPVAALSHGVLRIMLAQRLMAVPLALVAAVFAGGWLLATDPPAAKPAVPTPSLPVALRQPAPKAAEPKPLPKGPNKLLVWRKGELVTLDPDGKNEKVVVKDMHAGHRFALSPDGSKVAVVRPPADGEERGLLLHARLVVRELGKDGPGDDLGEGGEVVWSGDGTELAICQYDSRKELGDIRATHTVYNFATKKRTRLDLPERHIVTDWSRDGKFFLTTAKPDAIGGNAFANIYVMNRDGTIKKNLTDGKWPNPWGKFSPDGRRVLFLWIELKRPRQILRLSVIDIATGEATPVRDVSLNGNVHGYCWSPDGKRIAYTWQEVHEGKFEEVRDKETESVLVVCDPDGGNPKTIATEKGKGDETTIGGVDWR